MFWSLLYAAPVAWCVLGLIAILKLNIDYLLLVVIAVLLRWVAAKPTYYLLPDAGMLPAIFCSRVRRPVVRPAAAGGSCGAHACRVHWQP